MAGNLWIEVKSVTPNKEEGGNDIDLDVFDEHGNRSRTVLHPGVIAETEWGPDGRMVTLPMGTLHARRVTETLRKNGWPSAGTVLDLNLREKYSKG